MALTQEEKMEAAGWITVAKAAEAAGVTAPTIYDWIQGAKIEGTQVGGRHYVRLQSLIKHLGPVGAKAAGLIGEEAC